MFVLKMLCEKREKKKKEKRQTKVLVHELGGKGDARRLFGGSSSFSETCDFSSALLQRGSSPGGTVTPALSSATSALTLWLCLVTSKGDQILMGQAPFLTATTFMAVLALQSPELTLGRRYWVNFAYQLLKYRVLPLTSLGKLPEL